MINFTKLLKQAYKLYNSYKMLMLLKYFNFRMNTKTFTKKVQTELEILP